MGLLSLSRWSPYLVGGGIGVLVWLSFIFSNRPIGCSTAYVRLSGLIEKKFRGEKVENKEYYRSFLPKVGWEVLLIVGVILGAFTSAILSGNFSIEIVPQFWKAAFSSNILIRSISAVLGGFFVGFGARLAGGCTSGHGISGTSQLAVGSWLALISFFFGGFVSASLLYGLLGGL